MKIIQSELATSVPKGEDKKRLDYIAQVLLTELENGGRNHWDLPFAKYVDERMGDLDWEGDGKGEDYANAKAYIISQIPPQKRK